MHHTVLNQKKHRTYHSTLPPIIMATAALVWASVAALSADPTPTFDRVSAFEDLKNIMHTLPAHEATARLTALRDQMRTVPAPPHQDKVEHVVVLLMENHAADNMFGCMVRCRYCKYRARPHPTLLHRVIPTWNISGQQIDVWVARTAYNCCTDHGLYMVQYTTRACCDCDGCKTCHGAGTSCVCWCMGCRMGEWSRHGDCRHACHVVSRECAYPDDIPHMFRTVIGI